MTQLRRAAKRKESLRKLFWSSRLFKQTLISPIPRFVDRHQPVVIAADAALLANEIADYIQIYIHSVQRVWFH